MAKPSIKQSSLNRSSLVRNFILLTALEALFALTFMFTLPKSESNSLLFGYSLSRLAIIFTLLLANLMLFWLSVNYLRSPGFEEKIVTYVHSISIDQKKSDIFLSTLSIAFLSTIFLLFIWLVTDDKFLLGYFVRFGPLLIFGALVLIQIIVVLKSQLKEGQIIWMLSIILGIFLLIMQGWPLVTSNKLDNLPAIVATLGFTIYTQDLFRRKIRSNPKDLAGMVFASITVGALILTQKYFIPKKFLIHLQTLYIYSPIILIGLPTIADLIRKLLKRIYKNRLFLILFYIVLSVIFIISGINYYNAGKSHAEQVNITYAPEDDELAYMDFAIKARESGFRYTGIRNQMPVYPYIQALFYKPNEDLDQFYARGKQINIILSLISLAVILLISRKCLPLPQAVNMTLVSAFGLYVFKSGYFMVELLYYTMAFAVYVILCLLLIKPSIKTSVFAGIFLGIAHLTKASVLPGLLLFIVAFSLKEITQATRIWKMNPFPLNKILDLPNLKTEIISLSMVLFCFFAIVSPYIFESKRIYGEYFYNVNSTFYMWYDSYEEALEGTIAHGDTVGWPNLPAEEIPSAGKYFREHTFSQILDRIRYGLHWQVENIRFQYGFFNYPVYLFLLTIILLLFDLKMGFQLTRENFPLVIFSAGYFLGYLFLYIWYSPIANLPRFLYALYVPILFSLFILAQILRNKLTRPIVKTANLAIFLMICIDIWHTASYGPFFRDFGS